ncbi:MAG: PPC domain-containing DNA-binding protein [Halanaerobiaceae bacterium]
MRTFTGEGLGRIVVLNFERGEKLLEGIKEKLAELGIKDAVLISGIGTFSQARIHRVTTLKEEPTEEYIEYNNPIELSSVDGMVVDGEPHLHMTFTDLNKTYSGHLEDDSVVLYLAEIVFAELKDLKLKREKQGYLKLLTER